MLEFLNEHRKLINVIILGFGFLFIFGAFQTSAMVETSVLNAETIKTHGNFTGKGYYSLAIIYMTFAFANWIAPIVVVWITPKYSMIVAGVIYSLFIISFLHPITWILYFGSFLLGVAAAILWTGQGNFLSMNSNTNTISKNTAIFWILFQSSLVFGNIVQYFVFRKTEQITDSQQILFYSIFGVCSFLGTFLLLFLRKPDGINYEVVKNDQILEGDLTDSASDSNILLRVDSPTFTPLEAFFQSFHLIRTKHMLLLFVPMIYTGFELMYFSGVYGTAVGQTQYFGDKAKGYIGLIGILIGLGEITSSLIFNLLHKLKPTWFTPDTIIVIGLIIHCIAFFLSFISLPFDSTEQSSSLPTYITPNAGVLIFCGYLLGFADSIFNTQIISLLGDYYQGIENPSAFALFKFSQSLSAGIGFLYSNYLGLQWQLLILCVSGILGTITFIYVERQVREIIIERNYDQFANPGNGEINVGGDNEDVVPVNQTGNLNNS